ncbi:MAG: tetratricopeptide repeat protein, partial [Spirochaetes bacterium]|nr:tetratricopeptide repeat protein [Spirochaetota bacterium]
MSYLIFLIFIALTIAVIFTISRGNLTSKIHQAGEFFDNGEIQKSSELIKLILSKKKDFVPALFIRSKILILQKQYLMATSELQNILSVPEFSKFVNEIEIRQMLARIYNETQQWEKEVNEYEKLLQLDPENFDANYRYGLSLYNRKKYSDARKYLLKALELDPSLTDIYFQVGLCYFEISHFYEAEEYLLKAKELPEYQLDSSYFLGMIYLKREDLERAVEMFETSKSSQKYFIPSIYELGEIYFSREAYDKAITILEKGIDKLDEKKPESIDFRYLLAECYIRENMIIEAIEHLKKVIKADREYKDAKQKLENYKGILSNDNIKFIFDAPPEKLQPLLHEIITRMNYNVISKEIVSKNELLFRAF